VHRLFGDLEGVEHVHRVVAHHQHHRATRVIGAEVGAADAIAALINHPEVIDVVGARGVKAVHHEHDLGARVVEDQLRPGVVGPRHAVQRDDVGLLRVDADERGALGRQLVLHVVDRLLEIADSQREHDDGRDRRRADRGHARESQHRPRRQLQAAPGRLGHRHHPITKARRRGLRARVERQRLQRLVHGLGLAAQRGIARQDGLELAGLGLGEVIERVAADEVVDVRGGHER